MLPPEPLVSAPVHPLGLLREGLRHVRAPSEPLPNRLRPAKCTAHRVLPLTLVDQVVAMTAQEILSQPVQHSHLPTAARARTDEPRSLSTKVAGSPVKRHVHLYVFPLISRTYPVSVEQ